VFFHQRVARASIAVLAALSPFCAVTFSQAAWKATHYDATAFRNNPPAPRIAGARKSPRVLWVIADEWDYRLTFVDRDTRLMLPKIDRLRNTSLYADHAIPPGPETPISIPGYYSGKLVEHVRHDGARELQVAYHADLREVLWSAQPSVFDHVRALGTNTALLEWYHPTCRVLGKSDPRIPYLLKLASQKEEVAYTQQFNAVLSAVLLLGVLLRRQQAHVKCCGLLKGPRAANAMAADGRPRLDGVIGWSRIRAVAGGAADGRASLSRFPPLEPGSDPRSTGGRHGRFARRRDRVSAPPRN
jgi:hypothetical protein